MTATRLVIIRHGLSQCSIDAVVGGIKGCTHLVELLGPLGTTAYQATGRARDARRGKAPLTQRPYQLNSCYTYKDDSPAVLHRWPQFYTGPKP